MLRDMSSARKFTFKLLGTGTSTGVPILSCKCPTCTSTNPKDNRLRCSALFTVDNKNYIIDTGPDFRQQMLINDIDDIEAVFYTHHHFDHIGGFDDLRGFNFMKQKFIPIYSNKETYDNIHSIFSYAFYDGYNQSSVPKVIPKIIESGKLDVDEFEINVLDLKHGSLDILGFRVGNIAYCTDTNYIPSETMKELENLEYLIIDGLRETNSNSHFTIDEAISQAKLIGAKKTYITHLAHQIKYDDWVDKLPDNIFLSYDGLTLRGEL